MGISFSALAKSSNLLNTSSGGELTTPSPTLVIHSISKHCRCKTNHIRQVGKSPIEGKREAVTGQWSLNRACGTGAWDSCHQLPHSTTLTAIMSLLCQTSHSAPVSHSNSISPLASAQEVGQREEGKGKKVQGLTILEILPHMQLLLTIVFGRGGHVGEPRAARLVWGGRPHCGVQCWLWLITERQWLVAGQPTGQCLHQFELPEPIGHSVPPGLPRKCRAEVMPQEHLAQGQ